MSVRRKAANLKTVHTRIPSTVLPSEEDVPQFSEDLVERFPSLVEYNDDLKVFYRDLRRFILEQDRLVNENSGENTNG